MEQNQKRLCKVCGESFIVNIHNQIYCSKKCKVKNDNDKIKAKRKKLDIKEEPRNTYTYVCSQCGKTLHNRHRSVSENQFCDANCRIAFHKQNFKIAKCITCGSEFSQKHKNHAYCSKECKPSKRKSTTYKCDNCGNKFTTQEKRNGENKFCNRECYEEYMDKNKLVKKCEVCGRDFKTRASLSQRFCCIECHGKWQSENRVGKNSPTYKHNISIKDRTIICEWCISEFMTLPYKIETRRFCSDTCRQKWFNKFIYQTDEWKSRSREVALKNLRDGLISTTNSYPQRIINSLLSDNNINYINEYIVKYFSMDNYLCDHGLFIEVMGDYWHSNHLKYPKVKYKHQKKTIRNDKAKHTYIKNKYNQEILYLWEHDICNDVIKCELIIEMFIKNKGVLPNYHSFNYDVLNENLVLKNVIEIPYMDYDNESLLKICDYAGKPQSA